MKRATSGESTKEVGAALIMVIGLGLVMILLISTGLTVAMSGLRQAATEQSSVSALDAAYAGVQDYLARVNTDPTYVNNGNVDSSFKGTSTFTGTAGNPAFNVGEGEPWATVAGSGGAAAFRYEVDNSTYSANGFVNLRVTGRSGAHTRSLVVPLRVRGFVDYSYFTDYEIQDPAISGAPTTGTGNCLKYAYAGRPAQTASANPCSELQFGKTDVLSGDVHSNDTLRICGAQFLGTVTTANPTGAFVKPQTSCNNTGITVIKADNLTLPDTNTSMKEDAGCLYTGPTRFEFSGATMTVHSPWTTFTHVEDGVGSNPAECGSPAALQSGAGATIGQLENDLVYVQSVPGGTTDPNYTSPTSRPDGLSCIDANGAIGTSGNGIGWSFTKGSGKRYPLVNESPATYWSTGSFPGATWSTGTPAYGCRNGDAYVEGTVSTRMTIASANYVYVVDDVGYADRDEDVLGLVGQNSVIVWNPTKYLNTTPDGLDQFSVLSGDGGGGRSIDAAVISVAHTFQVQNFDRGSSRGALNLYGSIAQKFRGPTRSVDPYTNESTGYTKSYAYDPKLKTVSPPKFLSSTSARFQITRYATVPAAFLANGKKS